MPTHPRSVNRRCLLKVSPTRSGCFASTSRACSTCTTLLFDHDPLQAPQSRLKAIVPLFAAAEPRLLVPSAEVHHPTTQVGQHCWILSRASTCMPCIAVFIVWLYVQLGSYGAGFDTTTLACVSSVHLEVTCADTHPRAQLFSQDWKNPRNTWTTCAQDAT